MIIISLLLARCLLGTWGDNLYPSSHSVFSIAQWNRNYQSHFTDGATGLWGQETYEVYAINGGGGKKTLKFTKSEVCLLHLPQNPPVNSLMWWPGLWLRICDHSEVFRPCFLGTCLPLWFGAWPLPKAQLSLCVQWPSSPPLQLNLRIIQFRYWRWLNSLEMWFHSSFLETIRLAIVISHLGEIFWKEIGKQSVSIFKLWWYLFTSWGFCEAPMR